MQSGVHHHTNTRRVQIPSVAASGMQAQHQIVMTGNGNNQLAQSSSQQPYTVVVSSQDNILTGGTSQMSGTRIQYTTRQEGPSERQTIYRTIAPTGTKRTSPANPAQRVGVCFFRLLFFE
ncbi:unnamed protein product [Anisakis simplex]|uniref:KID domain-containing protein n=1 Tax=Anisakis simplex TaxID=6269 RepID=A0A0M3JDE7_ANISI|nr:unnamed protein product [Anisakis simplex]